MHHLFLGIDPTELGGAPFALADRRRVTMLGAQRARPRRSTPAPRLYMLPCIAGHVGADAAGAMLSEGAAPPGRDDAARRCRHQCRDRARQPRSGWSPAPRPTGPAFEGAEISCGQRAAPGAIERVRIDPRHAGAALQRHRLRPWSDEPGFEEAAAATGVTGICGSGIIEVVAEMYLAGIITAGRRHRRRAGGALAAHPAERPHLLLPAARRRAARSPSRRTTCAPSSSPRRRSMPASSC